MITNSYFISPKFLKSTNGIFNSIIRNKIFHVNIECKIETLFLTLCFIYKINLRVYFKA